jgi:pyrroline-5-carboxylate reductase
VSIRSAESKARLQSVLPPNGQRVQVLVGETTRAIEAADIVILACKPTQYREILSSPGVGTALAGKTLVSILGGVTESDLRAVLRDVKCEILRALPNLAALVGESTTIISEVSNAEALEAVRQLFLQVGTVHVLPVEKIETAAVITASGPAFFATILESFSQALISKGFDEATAQALAAGSMRSCSSLAIAGHSPSYITKQVATVGGSTEKGLEVLEILNVGSSVDQAINAIFEAAKNLGKPTAKSTSSGVAQAKAEAIPTSMNAAVLKGVRQIVVESRPVPVILNPGDMIVKIKFAGLCGRYAKFDSKSISCTF